MTSGDAGGVARIRDYREIVDRVEALRRAGLRTEILGRVRDLPIYAIHLKPGAGRRRSILMSAGTHGDEPAGPEALLRFLERDPGPPPDRFEFLVLPCVNPYGYERDTRENGDGLDINRVFEEVQDLSPEARLVKRLLLGRRFDLFIEFHEDWEYDGFYLFEERRNGPRIGARITRQVEAVGPVNRNPEIEGFPALDGVLSPNVYAEGLGVQAMPLYVYRYHSDHVITCETPSRWDLERRVASHLVALRSALACQEP